MKGVILEITELTEKEKEYYHPYKVSTLIQTNEFAGSVLRVGLDLGFANVLMAEVITRSLDGTIRIRALTERPVIGKLLAVGYADARNADTACPVCGYSINSQDKETMEAYENDFLHRSCYAHTQVKKLMEVQQ